MRSNDWFAGCLLPLPVTPAGVTMVIANIKLYPHKRSLLHFFHCLQLKVVTFRKETLALALNAFKSLSRPFVISRPQNGKFRTFFLRKSSKMPPLYAASREALTRITKLSNLKTAAFFHKQKPTKRYCKFSFYCTNKTVCCN